MSWPLKEKNKKIRYFIFEKKSPISAFFSFVFLLLIILPITYCLDNTSRDVPVSNWKFTASNGYHYKYDEFPKNLKEYSILKGTTASASDLKKFLPGLAFNYKIQIYQMQVLDITHMKQSGYIEKREKAK